MIEISDTTDPLADLAALKARIAVGRPATKAPAREHRAPRPLYLLYIDEPDDRSIVLIVRTGDDGITRARIVLPRWEELPPGWDGKHLMSIAIPLADDYAQAYGYYAIAVDIESSQLWDPAWGSLSGRGGAL